MVGVCPDMAISKTPNCQERTIDIGIPIWPAKLLVPVAFSVLSLRLMLQVWGFARAFATNADRPVAVPLVVDAATQAALEAQHVSGRED